MKQSATVENWYLKGVYLEYLNSLTRKQLSPDTILTVTVDDEQPWHSFIATDIQTNQVMTIDNEGYVSKYNLSKVA